MDTLTSHRQAIQQLLREYASQAESDEVETQLVFDHEHDHYQLVYVGWENDYRVYGCVMHFDIKDGKVWIQHNGTEVDVAAALETLGVPKEEIVIGFHSPFKRQFTDYAIG
jgi:hypothetical protein